MLDKRANLRAQASPNERSHFPLWQAGLICGIAASSIAVFIALRASGTEPFPLASFPSYSRPPPNVLAHQASEDQALFVRAASGELVRFDVPGLRSSFKAELIKTLTARTADGPRLSVQETAWLAATTEVSCVDALVLQNALSDEPTILESDQMCE